MKREVTKESSFDTTTVISKLLCQDILFKLQIRLLTIYSTVVVIISRINL